MSGIELKTIQIMIDNGFDSVHSLLAARVDTDLDQIPNLLLGQKSILREALQDLQNEYKELKFKLKIDNSFARRLLEESLIDDHNSRQIKTPNMSPINTPVKSKNQEVVKTIEDKIQTISEKFGIRSANTGQLSLVTSGTAFINKDKCDVCGRQGKKKFPNGMLCGPCLYFYEYNFETNDHLVCNSEDNCLINKNTKVNCRRCRFNKCLQIIGNESTTTNPIKNEKIVKNQSKNSSNESDLKVSLPNTSSLTTDVVIQSQPFINLSPISLPPNSLNKSKICNVCGDEKTKGKTNLKSNYGVLTCGGCGSFFTRVNTNEIIITECIESDNKCVINPMTRNICKYCRYQACLRAGMTHTNKFKGNGTKQEEPIDQNGDQQPEEVLPEDDEEEQVLPEEEKDEEVLQEDDRSDVSASTGFDYTLIRCGRTPESPMNEKNPKRLKN